MSTPTKKPRTKELDAALIALLKQYKERHGLGNDELGNRLHFNGTYVSRAFSGKFEGDAQGFERAVRDLLNAETAARVTNTELLKTGFMVEPMKAFLDSVRNSRNIGVTWSDPGMGKSDALDVYAADNSLCTKVTLEKHANSWQAVRDSILEAIPDKRRIKSSLRSRALESWDSWLKRNFVASGHLLIIDNAHLMTAGARHWVAYDWHDVIKCPVALIGNEEIEADWRKNAQHKTRVGLCCPMESQAKVTDTVKAMMKLHLQPAEEDKESLELGKQILKGDGSLRLLKNHLLIASDLIKAKPKDYTPASAIVAANGMLLTDVDLAA